MGTHHRGTAQEVRALDALVKLVRCAASVQARLEPGIRAERLSPNQFGVLEALFHLGPLEPCELGPKLLTSRPNVVLLVDQLEERGLARRTPVESDRRRVRVELTAAGRRAITKAFQGHARRVAEELSALSPQEQDQLGRLCKQLGLGKSAASARARTG
jgi:MarR family transcriptional regulator, 2-MHQ and catechol-resistance regulon repressor